MSVVLVDSCQLSRHTSTVRRKCNDTGACALSFVDQFPCCLSYQTQSCTPSHSYEEGYERSPRDEFGMTQVDRGLMAQPF